jgi:hypothetical protein
LPEEFFEGQLRGHGLFLDRFGQLRRTFVIDLKGTRQGDNVTLEEHLQYDDGEEIYRTYTITKTSDNHYIATADSGLVGDAKIASYGNTLNWRYKYRQEVGGREWILSFDDWMFRQSDDLVLNWARVTKWGFRVGELFMSISKSPESKDVQ